MLNNWNNLIIMLLNNAVFEKMPKSNLKVECEHRDTETVRPLVLKIRECSPPVNSKTYGSSLCEAFS